MLAIQMCQTEAINQVLLRAKVEVQHSPWFQASRRVSEVLPSDKGGLLYEPETII